MSAQGDDEAVGLRLREGFADLAEEAASGPDCPEPDRLWAAAAGEGTPAERREIVLHTASCASCAAAFRLARGLARDGEGAVQAGASEPDGSAPTFGAHEPPGAEADRKLLAVLRPPRGPWRRYRAAISIAAALAALVVLALALPRLGPTSDPVYRGGKGGGIHSLVGTGGKGEEEPPLLPRQRADLSWTPGPDGSRYEVRLLTAEGEEILTEPGLSAPRFRIPSAALQGRAAGARLLWQVTALHPDGSREISATFTVRLQ